MANKKIFNGGQVTVYIIIAIVLLLIIVLLFIRNNFKYEKGIENSVKNSNFIPIYSFVHNCLEQTTIDGTYYIGETGGYFIPFKFSTTDGIAYYYINGENYIPSKQIINEGISDYIENYIDLCIVEFSDFPEFSVDAKDINVNTYFDDKNIFVDADYSLNIKKGAESYQFKEFEFTIPIRLGLLYNISNQIIQDLNENKGDICLSCINELAQKNNISADLFDYDNETTLFVLTDPQSNITREPFKYYFTIK